MSEILVKKLRGALNQKNPIQRIEEILSEYEELLRKAKWRRETIIKGKNLEKHRTELDKIAKEIAAHGYDLEMCNCDVNNMVSKFFKNKF